IERNAEGAPSTIPYVKSDPENPLNSVKVVGNPTLGDPKAVMIGVRNVAEDHLNKCGEIWVNELRMQGLNEEGGMAALARLDVQLADLGRLNFASNFSTIGWGSIDQKLVQRQKERMFDYNVSANLQLNKLLPDNWNLSIPFFAQYSNATSTPKYDPYDNDLTMDQKLESVTPAERDSVQDQAIIREVRKTVSLNNVRIMRGNQSEKTPKPWDVQNFSASYSKTTSIISDPIIEEDKIEQQQGSLDYNYSAQPLYITPLKNAISNDKFLKFLTEFNFNPIPSSLGFRNEINRFKSTTEYRFMEPEFSDWYTKRFTWDRNYNLAWNLSRSLRLNFDAISNSIIDELPVLDGNRNENDQNEIRQFLWDNLTNLGRPKNYQHNINLTYALPFKYFPVIDFIDVGAQVATTYTWSAAALNALDYGNVIQNSQTRSVNANINLVDLYNKVGYLKSVNDFQIGKPTNDGNPRSRQRPGENSSSTGRDSRNEESSGPGIAEAALLRPIMSIRTLKVNYSENFRSVVPGFTPTPKFFGMNDAWSSPGLGYVLGIQPTDSWLDGLVSGSEEYITNTILLNQEVVRNRTQRIDATLEVEPFRDFKVTVTANKNYVENNFEFFKVQD
ncbi:MAG: cell surface protein SprA, partial [Saprospiraceae bacterium]|nr:cell surface protein SprA [Saprospiraceae bacterium]